MPVLKRILTSKPFIALVALVGLYTIGGFWLAPYLVRHYGPRLAAAKLGKTVEIGALRLNPYLFTLDLDGLWLKEADGRRLVGFNHLGADFELWQSIRHRRWTIRQLAVTGLSVSPVWDQGGELNLAHILPAASDQRAAPTSTGKALPRFLVQEISLGQGRIDLVDQRQSRPAALHLEGLELAIHNLSSLPGQAAQVVLRLTTSCAEALRLSAQLGLQPLTATGSLALDDLGLTTIFQFGADAVNLAPPDGKLRLAADFELDEADGTLHAAVRNLRLGLDGLALRLADEASPFFEMAGLTLDAGVELDRHQLDIDGLTMHGGRARIEVGPDGRPQLTRLLAAKRPAPAATAAPPPARPAAAPSPWKINLRGLDLKDLALDYRDQSRQPGLTASVANIRLGLTAAAEIGGATPQLRVGPIELTASDLHAVSAAGQTPLLRLERLGCQAVVVVEGAAPSIKVEQGRLTAAGLSASLGPPDGGGPLLRLDQLGLAATAELGGAAGQGKVQGLGLQANGLVLGPTDGKNPLLRLDRLGLEGGELELAAQNYTADSITLQGGKIDLRRTADGGLDLGQVGGPRAPIAKASGATIKPRKVKPAKKSKTAQAPPTLNAVKPAGKAAPPPHFRVKSLRLAGLDVAFSDQQVKPKTPLLRLRDLSLSLADIDGRSPMPCSLGFTVAEGGRLRATGSIQPTPGPALEATVQVDKLNLAPFQPYLGQVVAIDLKSGTVSAKGKLRYGFAGAGAKNGYLGGLAVEGLRLTEAGDRETLAGWGSLATKQAKLSLTPLSLDIGDLRLTGPVGKFIIDKDRNVNLATALKAPPKARASKAGPVQTTKASEPSGEPFSYKVRRLLVDGGQVDFADLSLPTPFGTHIHKLRGVVAGLASDRRARSQIQLEGQVDDYGSATIAGEMATFDPALFTDIGLSFRNLEMARLTPYSGKFAGRVIKSGKLSVDLKYMIDNGELTGDNKFVVERLTLGDKVDSPDAVNLPLDLAIALLEDSHGVIDLGLPVHGNLNHPEFSVGSLVWKAVTSLLAKIVTSPFRLLGALLPDFRGEADFNRVAFAAGRAELAPPEREKLATLAAALAKRPQLRLAVTGTYQPVEGDAADLQRRQVAASLATLLGEPAATGEDLGPVDFSSPEVEKGLIELFKRRFGPEELKALKVALKAEVKARKAAAKKAGDEAEEEPGQLAKRLFARLADGEKIGEEALVKLAEARTQAVLTELSLVDKVAAERLSRQPAKALEAKAPIAVELSLEGGR